MPNAELGDEADVEALGAGDDPFRDGIEVVCGAEEVEMQVRDG